MDGNKFAKMGNEIIYEIRTDPKTFEQYLRDCESLAFSVINEEVNVPIGKVSVPDLASIISKNSYGGYFSIIDKMGFTVGDIYISFDLFLLQKHSATEVKPHHNSKIGIYPYSQKEGLSKLKSSILKSKKKGLLDIQNEKEFNLPNSDRLFAWLCDGDVDDDDKALKQISSNNRNIEKADSESNNRGIQKDVDVDMKATTSPNSTGDGVQHQEAVKQANCMRINILSLSLSHTLVQQEKSSLKDVRSNYSSLHQNIVNSSIPFKTAYFVEYEIPAVLNIATNKRDITRKSCPWNTRIIRFCSRKHTGSDIYFGQSSVHYMPRRKGCWLENLKDLKIVVKLFFRNANQRSPLQIGKTTLKMCNFMKSENLTFSSESPVFSSAQVPVPVCIGTLRTKMELGRDCRYFGKEFLNAIMSESSSTVKVGETRKNKELHLPEGCEKVFEKDSDMLEKEQLEQNKENLPKTEVKQQYVEKPLLLYGLLYISSGQGFNVMNSYVISKSFWKEDIAVSNICWETYCPNYSLREIVPVLLSAEFLERCHNNFLILEVWERKPVAQNDTLIGIAKLPLNQFFVAFRNPLLTEQLIQAKYPVVGVNGWVNVSNPINRLQAGQLHAILCLGSEDQIQLFERVHGIMETSYVPIRMQPSNSMHFDFSSKPENFTEVSVSRCQFNSDPKQVVLPSKSVHGNNVNASKKEVPLNVHQQNKMEVNQEHVNTIKNNTPKVINPPEVLTKQLDASFMQMIAKQNNLQQNMSENKSTHNHSAYELSHNADNASSDYQEPEQEGSADSVLGIISSISIAENIPSNESDTIKQKSNLDDTQGGSLNDSAFVEQTCTVKNQQCQTDLFVLDLQHYDAGFTTKRDKNIEPLIIKLSNRGLEIIEMNGQNAKGEILDTKSFHSNNMKDRADEEQNHLQLAKDVACFKQQDTRLHSDADEATYSFSFSGDKEHAMLNSVDDPVVNNHDNTGDSVCKFNTNDDISAKKNQDGVDNDHIIKSVSAIRGENKFGMCNSNENSVKQPRTLTANETTNSKKVDCHLMGNMVECITITDKVHVYNNHAISEEPEDNEDRPLDLHDNQSKSVCFTDNNNFIMDKHDDLNKHTIKSNVSKRSSSFHIKKHYAQGNTVDISNNAKQDILLSKNETSHHIAKDRDHFKNIEEPTEASDSAQLSNYAFVVPEYSVVSASDNFCARIEIDEAVNLLLHEQNEAGRNVYVSFHLNQGCAKVIVDGEIQLKTGLVFTPIAPCKSNPVWNWHCEAWLSSDLLTNTSKQLLMKICQKSNKSDAADILLGFAAIDLTVMLGTPWVCGWFNIISLTGSCIGQIKVSVKPQENLDRFRTDGINTSPISGYPQAINSNLKRREHCHSNMQKINFHPPEKPTDRKIQHVKHSKTANKASALADTEALKHEKNVLLEWDLDLPDDSTSLLTKVLRQKLSELDDITKRLKRRLLSVTSERTPPQCLVWEQEETDILYCEKNDQKQNSATKSCPQMCTEAKDESYNTTHTLLSKTCCTKLGTINKFQHSENLCQPKHLDHLANVMHFSKSSKTLDNETSYEQLQCNCETVSEHQLTSKCLQCNGGDADFEIEEKNVENNETEKDVNKDNDVEDFDALTDMLMEAATKEFDIANVFNPLLFQHLLLTNANLIQRKCQRDKHNKQENVHNISDSQNGSEIVLNYDETFLAVCTMKEVDDRNSTEVQGDKSCSSENNNMQFSERICNSDLNSIHKMVEIDKCKKLGNRIFQEKFLTNKRDSSETPKLGEQLVPNISQSPLGTEKTISNLEKQCKPQQFDQMFKIPINEHSYLQKASVNNGNEVQERFSEQELNESIKKHKEDLQSCSELSSVTNKQKFLHLSVKETIDVNSQSENEENCSKKNPSALPGKRKQRSGVCRLAPLFFQTPKIAGIESSTNSLNED